MRFERFDGSKVHHRFVGAAVKIPCGKVTDGSKVAQQAHRLARVIFGGDIFQNQTVT